MVEEPEGKRKGPRPKGVEAKTARIDVPVPKHVSERLDTMAAANKVTRTIMAREILYDGLGVPVERKA